MSQRFYLDTSVYGGYYDEEFQQFTRILFSEIKSERVTILFSDVIGGELERAPKRIQDFVKSIESKTTEFLEVDDEAVRLAQLYIEEGVVGQTSFDDCLHIALATIHNADVLISWNFKHIVNIYRIRGYNSINLKLGYKTLEIRSPKEMVRHGNRD